MERSTGIQFIILPFFFFYRDFLIRECDKGGGPKIKGGNDKGGGGGKEGVPIVNGGGGGGGRDKELR